MLNVMYDVEKLMETLIMVLEAVVGLMTGFSLAVLLDRRRKRKLAEKIEVAY